MFAKWFQEAKKSEINDPNAMNLSTISKNLTPSSRIVLLKHFDEKGFIFYSNSKSKKGKSIYLNNNVSLNFHWKSLQRQIRIEGKVFKLSTREVDNYFNTRPIESKIGAWASKQSSVLTNRKELKNRFEVYSKKFNKNIPRPPHWLGYRVRPTLIEFWQEMPFRLHDRAEYKKNKKKWLIRKLYP